MIIISTAFMLVYSTFILVIIWSWNSIKKSSNDKFRFEKNIVNITVLVPVRNEAENIEVLIRSIYKVAYDESRYEVIVINDHSTDNTRDIVTNLAKEYDQLKIIDQKIGISGKKKAIELGVSFASGEIIVCTDGDCYVPQNWLAVYAETYRISPNSVMVFGGVRYKSNDSFIINLLNIELSILQMIGGASMNLGIPTMINGANFSYTKAAFKTVDGYSGNRNIPSGDDEFLLRKLHSQFSSRIYFLKAKSTIVETLPPSSFATWINQRRRWAAKWKYHTDVYSKLIPVFIFLFNVFSVYMIFNVFSGNERTISMIFLGLKAVAEYVLISISTRFLGVSNRILNFVYLQLIYPFYVVFFAIASNFGRYTWKGREYNN
ncbi:MAG: biofilm PGA synthesis N-glycosyltransferase PgaC [Cyclobacteriaceae bacterium]|jgi:biofilm PGA synthesis N-glycosyltransferase PgaC